MKTTVTTENIGNLYGNEIGVMTEDSSKKLSYEIDIYIKSRIKPKPRWFPSEKLWFKLAGKFLIIEFKR